MKPYFFLFAVLLCMSLISAVPQDLNLNSYKPQEYNTTFQFSFSDVDQTACNITTLNNPDGTIIFLNQQMTKTGSTFNGSVANTYLLTEGAYCVNIECSNNSGSVCREITGNGKAPPGDFTILGFSFLMILIFGSITVYIVKAVGNIIETNFDLLDVATAWGLYFALLGANLLANLYLGTLEVLEWLNLFVTILGFPMILIPMFAFFLSLIVSKNKRKKEAMKW